MMNAAQVVVVLLIPAVSIVATEPTCTFIHLVRMYGVRNGGSGCSIWSAGLPTTLQDDDSDSRIVFGEDFESSPRIQRSATGGLGLNIIPSLTVNGVVGGDSHSLGENT